MAFQSKRHKARNSTLSRKPYLMLFQSTRQGTATALFIAEYLIDMFQSTCPKSRNRHSCLAVNEIEVSIYAPASARNARRYATRLLVRLARCCLSTSMFQSRSPTLILVFARGWQFHSGRSLERQGSLYGVAAYCTLVSIHESTQSAKHVCRHQRLIADRVSIHAPAGANGLTSAG